MQVNDLTKNEARVCAILVGYLYSMLEAFKRSIVESRPTANQREFKQINRLLDDMLKEHRSDLAYKLDEYHRRDIESGVRTFSENVALTQTKLYFQVRNEVINSDLPESCQEPVIQARMLELTIKIVNSICYQKKLSLNKRYIYLLDVLQALCTSWEDKQGQQALCRKIIQMEVERMLSDQAA